MSKADAVRAYRDSIYDAAEYEAQRRQGSRSFPLVGGFWAGLNEIANAVWRPIKVGAALVLGYGGAELCDFPAMPPVPEAFIGTSLEQSFKDSWKLNEEAARARVEGVAKLLDLDVTGYWQKGAVAAHVEARDRNVVFAEEGEAARRAGDGGSFAAALLSSRENSGARGL